MASQNQTPQICTMKAEDAEIIKQLSIEMTNLHSSSPPQDVLPSLSTIAQAQEKLTVHLPAHGLGLTATIQHLQSDLAPAFNNSSRSPNYYGFITGGSTPVATLADNLVTLHDQNVQVHLPNETIATNVEHCALSLLCELLEFEPQAWSHRTFTTGATASNLLGLACGREYIIAEASAHRTDAENSVGEVGIVEAMRCAGIDEIQILTTVPHSSLSKAASILGLGRASVKTIGRADAPHKFDMQVLRKHLERPGVACIVAVSAGEVNTGLFATSGLEEMQELRSLCDIYGAWIHVDGAFGALARVLDKPEHSVIRQCCAGLELADSITGDGHKLLNVPYDCGFFLSRHRNIAGRVFQNPNAAYLATLGGNDSIMSPLNVGIENSRRFRALPVYASLVSYGRSGYKDMLERQIRLARGIAKFILDNEAFELLPVCEEPEDEVLSRIYIIVLFRARDEELNETLVDRIKATRKIYVSGTSWDGRCACRFAVSNWQTDKEKDLPIIEKALNDVVEGWKCENEKVRKQ